MGYGSRSPRTSRPWPRGRSAALAGLAGLFSFVVLFSCSILRPESFDRALARLDGALASSSRGPALDAAFETGYHAASTSSDWLSMLKRAREVELAGDKGRYQRAAERALGASARSEALAAALAHAFMRSGEDAKAYALFKDRLSPDSTPGFWAETVLALSRLSRLPPGTLRASDLERLAGLAGQPRLLVNATVLYLAEGNVEGAGKAAARAIASGADPGSELLWDSGRFQELAGRREAPSDGSEGKGAAARDLALVGDAAWRLGDRGAALRSWERSIALDPRASWKAYANVAILEEERAGGQDRAASYWNRMRAAFIAVKLDSVDTGALSAYAAHLARDGEPSAALSLLRPYMDKSGPGMLALAIQGRSWPPERYAAEAMRFADAHPDDGPSLEEALSVLAVRARFEDLAALFEAGSRRKVGFDRSWFYSAVLKTARGDYRGAAAILEKEGPAVPGPEAAFALGRIYRVLGDPAKAVARFEVARDSSRDGREKARALKELGRALSDSGDQGAAASAYRAAARADPMDPEAALLAQDPGRKKVKVP